MHVCMEASGSQRVFFSSILYLPRQDLPLNLEQANLVSLAGQFASWVHPRLSLLACLGFT